MTALYTLGSNGSGQLGIGHQEDVSVPKPSLFDLDISQPSKPSSPIVKVAAGGNHTLLLSRSDGLYWSGDSNTGACGVGPSPTRPVFQKVRLTQQEDEDLGHITMIAATWEASIVVTRKEEEGGGVVSRMYSFGAGMKGELGQGEFIVRTPVAGQFKDFPPTGTEIVDLSACMGHAVVVLSNGDVYGWGNCRKGQVGEPGAIIHEPRKVEDVAFKVTRAVCAKESTCLFGDPDSGNIRVLGSDKWELTSKAPQKAPAWVDVGASWGNFYILRQDGGLIGWGRDDHGQLPPAGLPPIRKMAIGSEHVVALTADGDVVSWGWGEHGNCGPKVENNDVKGRWNVIASAKLITGGLHINSIGAGCATSWISIASD